MRYPAVLLLFVFLALGGGWCLAALPRGFFAVVYRAFPFLAWYLPGFLLVWAIVSRWRGWISRRILIASLLLVVLVPACGWYATRIEPNRLALREVSMTSPRVAAPLRILHISDIQSARIGLHEARAIAHMAALKPDLIVHTGDLVQVIPPANRDDELGKLLNLLRALEPPLGIWHVHGDTDWHLVHRPKYPVDPLRVLKDSSAQLEWHGQPLSLHGLTLPSSGTVSPAVPGAVAWSQSSPGFRLLFGHNPNFILWARELDVDLCLAGHTHGGQIRLPLLGPLITMSEVPRDKARGWFRFGRTQVNVSAGIGGEHAAKLPTIRFNCPPEMTLITVTPAASAP